MNYGAPDPPPRESLEALRRKILGQLAAEQRHLVLDAERQERDGAAVPFPHPERETRGRTQEEGNPGWPSWRSWRRPVGSSDNGEFAN